MELKFRQLRADEIDCRVAQIKQSGLSLLLYKDARCDMNILDETVGPMNWQRKHGRENANCIVSIYDAEKKMWVEKEDTGTESNTEAEKGLASDSFKRACFNWGVGRELYTAPFIWVGSDKCEIKENGKDQRGNIRYACFDKFAVLDIKYTDGKISDLCIWNVTKNCAAYEMNKRGGKKPDSTKPSEKPTTKKESPKVDELIQNAGGTEYFMCSECKQPAYPFQQKDGSIMSARDMLAMSMKDFGKPLCRDCYKSAYNASKNR